MLKVKYAKYAGLLQTSKDDNKKLLEKVSSEYDRAAFVSVCDPMGPLLQVEAYKASNEDLKRENGYLKQASAARSNGHSSAGNVSNASDEVEEANLVETPTKTAGGVIQQQMMMPNGGMMQRKQQSILSSSLSQSTSKQTWFFFSSFIF